MLADLKRIWVEKAEKQFKIENLERKIRRTQLDLDAAFRAKGDILGVIDRELAATYEAYRQLEGFLMDREGAGAALLDQIDELKDLFFHALVVGIKLEGDVTGAWSIRDDVETSQLQNKALIKGVDWRSWRGWIKREIIQSDESYTYDSLNDFLSRLGSHAPAKRVQPVPTAAATTQAPTVGTNGETKDAGQRNRMDKPLVERKKKKAVVRKITHIEDVPDD